MAISLFGVAAPEGHVWFAIAEAAAVVVYGVSSPLRRRMRRLWPRAPSPGPSVQSDVGDAQVALTWITGSLARAGWPTLNPLSACAGILVDVLDGRLRSLELGGDPAAALGVSVERSRRRWSAQ
ncbi:hypothetical protein [Nocardiopsis sp. CNR-923]|uniref:hypothetical protein n=1 Tax=Nocardiopsis sp. CNR-923 TaxID=1904965 RepID=UPI0013018A59|nr:hypothetical protein [Nocardiopsis sp. CNR-923]